MKYDAKILKKSHFCKFFSIFLHFTFSFILSHKTTRGDFSPLVQIIFSNGYLFYFLSHSIIDFFATEDVKLTMSGVKDILIVRKMLGVKSIEFGNVKCKVESVKWKRFWESNERNKGTLKFKGIIEKLTFEIRGMIVLLQNKIAGMIEKHKKNLHNSNIFSNFAANF